MNKKKIIISSAIIIIIILLAIIAIVWINKKSPSQETTNIPKEVNVENENINAKASITCITGEQATWKTGTESAPNYSSFLKKLDNFENILNCKWEIEQIWSNDYNACRIDGNNWYFAVYNDDQLIFWNPHAKYVNLQYYTLDGVKKGTACENILQEDKQALCPELKTIDNNYLNQELPKIYIQDRKISLQDLKSKDLIENQIYDLFIQINLLRPTDSIKTIYDEEIKKQVTRRVLEVSVWNNLFLIGKMGGEIYSIQKYAMDGKLQGQYCEDTWPIGGGDHSNPNCKIPEDSISVYEYIRQVEEKCQNSN